MNRAGRPAGWLLLSLSACAAPGAPPACPAGAAPATVAEAYFGRSAPDRPEVSDADWNAFLAEVVTPAFPEGLTAYDSAGQWRGENGRILRERSKVLVLVLPGTDPAAARARLRPVEDAWKSRFHQESVLTLYRPACATF